MKYEVCLLLIPHTSYLLLHTFTSMSTSFTLNWAIMAVSLMNTILLLWLGVTVLLNAERRTWGLYLAGGGLLLGAAFFVSHTAIIGLSPFQLTWRNTIFWWTVGMVPAIMLPLAWYVIMLWYAGYWGVENGRLHRRQRYWFAFTMVVAFVGLVSLGIGVILLAVPSPELILLRLFIRWSIAGVPILAIGYSIYVVMCIALSLDALRQPEPSNRVMGTQARERAHPWLVAVAIAFLLVSFMVAGIMLWIVQDANQRSLFEIYFFSPNTIAVLDLIVASIIGVSIFLLGQAIVSYEIFTGKTLPRRGLLRHWQRVVFLAVGYGIIIGGTLALQVRSIYSLLLTTMLMTAFFALMSWQSYVERERYIGSLRPFVTSQRLYEQLLTQSVPQNVDFVSPFHALCRDVLDAQVAYLAALGPLAPLVGPPLVYPSQEDVNLPSLTNLIEHFQSPATVNLSVEPEQYGGAIWAIALWSERGLIGVFLLGPKVGDSLYTQEEIEIARTIGERLIDTQASAEMSQKLMGLQRERLAHNQVIDQQTRRVLHDDILPSLQTSLIALSSETTSENSAVNNAVAMMTDAHKQISDLLHNMPTISVPDVARLGIVEAFKRTVNEELAHAFQKITWQIAEGISEKSQMIPHLPAEVLFYAAREVVRNAMKHGGGDSGGEISLCIDINWQDGLIIKIEDDGVGVSSNTSTRGSGQGLSLHSTMMAVVGGSLSIDSVVGRYTAVTLTLPTNS